MVEYSCVGGAEFSGVVMVEYSCVGRVELSRDEWSCDGGVRLSRVVMVEYSVGGVQMKKCFRVGFSWVELTKVSLSAEHLGRVESSRVEL